MARQFWDLNLTSEQNFHPLVQGSLATVLEEVFHAAIEFVFEEVLKVFFNAELLVTVRQQADVND